MMLTSAQLSQLLDQTRKIAEEVGTFIEKERLHFSMDRVEHKGFNDLVSYVDKEAEKQLVAQLQAIFQRQDSSPKKGPIPLEGKPTIGSSTPWMGRPILFMGFRSLRSVLALWSRTR